MTIEEKRKQEYELNQCKTVEELKEYFRKKVESEKGN